MALLLAYYGQYLYDSGGALYALVQAILGISDLRRHWRRLLSVAWDTVTMWKELVPSGNHVPMPVSYTHLTLPTTPYV